MNNNGITITQRRVGPRAAVCQHIELIYFLFDSACDRGSVKIAQTKKLIIDRVLNMCQFLRQLYDYYITHISN